VTRRILHLTRDFPPRHAGGISTALGGLLAAASALEDGPRHAVISFDGWRLNRGPTTSARVEPPASADTPLPILHAEGPADLDAARAFAAALQPDVVHVHHALLFDALPDLFPTAAPPVLLTLHVLQFHLSRLRGLDAPTLSDQAEMRALASARAISTPTEAARQILLGAAPHLADRVFVTPLGVSPLPHSAALDECNRYFFNSIEIDGQAPATTLVYIGRFDALKGLPELISALPSIVAAHPETRVIIAGGIPENPKADRRWRRRLAHLSDAGVVLLPWLSTPEVAQLLSIATHFIAPSHAETCGLTLMEARAAGLHLIASDLAAHREVAPEATFFAAGDHEALTRATLTALAADTATPPRAAPTSPRWSDVLPDWVHFWAK